MTDDGSAKNPQQDMQELKDYAVAECDTIADLLKQTVQTLQRLEDRLTRLRDVMGSTGIVFTVDDDSTSDIPIRSNKAHTAEVMKHSN